MKYFWKTLEHKWYVFLASRKLGLPLGPAIMHDMSQFSRAELRQYDRQFFGDKGDPEGFAVSWLHHQNCNPHHWEYWMTRSDHSHGGSGAVDTCLPMPSRYIKEMIADWMGASKSYTGSWDMTDRLKRSLPRMKLHPKTRETVLAFTSFGLW